MQMHHETTVDQIGRVTLGSVGARRFSRTDDALSFTISRGHRQVTVRLDPSDTYTVTTHMLRTGRVVFEQADVYCDQLAEAVWQAHLEKRLNTPA